MTHRHTCDACGLSWDHQDSVTLSTEGHLCPGCKEPQFWITKDGAPSDLGLRRRFNRMMVSVLAHGPSAGEAFLSGVILGAEMADGIIAEMAEENERC